MQIAGAMACSGINAASHCKHPNSLSKLFFFSFFLSFPPPSPSHRAAQFPMVFFPPFIPCLFILLVAPVPLRPGSVPCRRV